MYLLGGQENPRNDLLDHVHQNARFLSDTNCPKACAAKAIPIPAVDRAVGRIDQESILNWKDGFRAHTSCHGSRD